MVTVHLTGRMGTEPILSIKRSISIETMLNFDGDGDGDGNCKHALTTTYGCYATVNKIKTTYKQPLMDNFEFSLL